MIRRLLLCIMLLTFCLASGCAENARVKAKGQVDMGVSVESGN